MFIKENVCSTVSGASFCLESKLINMLILILLTKGIYNGFKAMLQEYFINKDIKIKINIALNANFVCRRSYNTPYFADNSSNRAIASAFYFPSRKTSTALRLFFLMKLQKQKTKLLNISTANFFYINF